MESQPRVFRLAQVRAEVDETVLSLPLVLQEVAEEEVEEGDLQAPEFPLFPALLPQWQSPNYRLFHPSNLHPSVQLDRQILLLWPLAEVEATD